MAELSDQEMMRYNRQIILRGFDFEGQEALKDARVLVVGLGGLGCAATQYLAGAGVGQLTLLDFDTVSVSNLQRQTLHSDATVGQPKVDSAREALARINPYITLTPINALLDEPALNALIAGHDLVLDCTDNVAIRNQLNVGCFAAKVPLVSGAAIRMEGQITVFTWQEGEPLLPLSEPSVWRERPHLRGSGRHGAADRGDRFIAGDGSHQIAGALRSTRIRQNCDVRRDDLSVPRNEINAQPGLRGVRSTGAKWRLTMVCRPGKRSAPGMLPDGVYASLKATFRSERALPVVLKLRYCGIDSRVTDKLLRDIQRQGDGFTPGQQAVQRLTRRFKTGRQHFGVRGVHFQ
ncbi:molybdopterin biosynthesis protein MoeB [Citrobacter koseri]|uniref:Molybdopterin biosynthesis protein MoeB n=2 Tax=Citrobacter koseri TaxID=545 RepID=A0A447UU82_CITKO|nr:molybdopterin biosynthesis protein MoeB [Citrobacter koseri]